MTVKFRQEILAIKQYVPGKPITEVQEEYGITDIVKLASNENPLGPSPKARQAMNEYISGMHIYPDGNCTNLKRQLASKLELDEDMLILGNGSDEVLEIISHVFLAPGDEVIVADPTFSEYEFVSKLAGAVVRKIPLVDFKHDLKSMKEAITQKTKIVFICNPNNPSGTIVSQQELANFFKGLREDILVVIDEAYFEYVTNKDYPDTLELVRAGKNVIVTRTFSKIYGLAGLRIGYGISNPKIIGLMNRVREPFNVNLMAQVAATASLETDEHVRNSRTTNEQGKNYLYNSLSEMGLPFIPTQTNFILINTKTDAEKLFNRLLSKGVIIRPAHVFGLPDFIRVTIGTKEQNHRFIRVLKEVLNDENRD